MTDSPMSPVPVRRIQPGEPGIITSTCRKCGNEIRLAVNGMTREKVFEAIALFDNHPGECPGGFHVELGGWRRTWDLDKAVNAFFDAQQTAAAA